MATKTTRIVLSYWLLGMVLGSSALLLRGWMGARAAKDDTRAWLESVDPTPEAKMGGLEKVPYTTPDPRFPPTPSTDGPLAWPRGLDVAMHKTEMRLRMNSIEEEQTKIRLIQLDCAEYPCFAVFEAHNPGPVWNPEEVSKAVRAEVPDSWPGSYKREDAAGYLEHWVGVYGLLLEPLRGPKALDRAGARQRALLNREKEKLQDR